MTPFRRLKVGTRIGDDLTILDVVAEVRGRHPVYLAWSQAAWCPVACKVFRSFRDAEREAAVLAAVAHPNIVRGLGARRPRLLAMEFLDGPALSAQLRTLGQLPVGDSLRAAVHIGAALQSVHAAGYLHLDLKPGNVILAGSRPILIDFGSARPIGYAPRHFVGTDAFMSPEACRLGESLTPAADVYSLAAMLYELLTGETPFPSRSGVRHPQLDESAPSARHLRPALPRSLDALLMRCLAREPEARPALDELLPELNAEIRLGPRMWPAEFDPTPITRAATRRRRRMSCEMEKAPASIGPEWNVELGVRQCAISL